MQAKEQIHERVVKVISEQFGVTAAEVKPDTSFTVNLGADSLDSIELVMAVEDEFGIDISDEDAEELVYVQQVVDYLVSRLTSKG